MPEEKKKILTIERITASDDNRTVLVHNVRSLSKQADNVASNDKITNCRKANQSDRLFLQNN